MKSRNDSSKKYLKRKESSRLKKRVFLGLKIIGIFIIILIIGYKASATMHYMKDHKISKEYFEENPQNATIQPWMHIRMIDKEFGIDEEEIEGLTGYNIKPRHTIIPIKDLCIKKSLNCTKVITQLNALSKRDEVLRKEHNERNQRNEEKR